MLRSRCQVTKQEVGRERRDRGRGWRKRRICRIRGRTRRGRRKRRRKHYFSIRMSGVTKVHVCDTTEQHCRDVRKRRGKE